MNRHSDITTWREHEVTRIGSASPVADRRQTAYLCRTHRLEWRNAGTVLSFGGRDYPWPPPYPHVLTTYKSTPVFPCPRVLLVVANISILLAGIKLKILRNLNECGSRKFRAGEDGYPKSDLPWNSIARAARLHVPSRPRRGSPLRRSIRFTLVPVAHGNRLRSFRLRAVRTGDGDRRLVG
jgi:hypothetical protein